MAPYRMIEKGRGVSVRVCVWERERERISLASLMFQLRSSPRSQVAETSFSSAAKSKFRKGVTRTGSLERLSQPQCEQVRGSLQGPIPAHPARLLRPHKPERVWNCGDSSHVNVGYCGLQVPFRSAGVLRTRTLPCGLFVWEALTFSNMNLKPVA